MYIVEGNIGAGKSTFLRLIQEAVPQLTVDFEPVSLWDTHGQGESLLAQFYENPQRWTYTLETFTMACRVQEHLKQQIKDPMTLVERSIYSGHYVFARNGYLRGSMTTLEWNLYEQWFNFLIPGKCKPPLGFIYLKTSPEVSFKRIQQRNRSSEQEINYEYLVDIDKRHQEFLIEKKVTDELVAVPVLVLDCNEDFENNVEQWQQHVNSVIRFIMQSNAQFYRKSTISL